MEFHPLSYYIPNSTFNTSIIISEAEGCNADFLITELCAYRPIPTILSLYQTKNHYTQLFKYFNRDLPNIIEHTDVDLNDIILDDNICNKSLSGFNQNTYNMNIEATHVEAYNDLYKNIQNPNIETNNMNNGQKNIGEMSNEAVQGNQNTNNICIDTNHVKLTSSTDSLESTTKHPDPPFTCNNNSERLSKNKLCSWSLIDEFYTFRKRLNLVFNSSKLVFVMRSGSCNIKDYYESDMVIELKMLDSGVCSELDGRLVCFNREKVICDLKYKVKNRTVLYTK